MSRHGRINLLGMLALPLVATLGSVSVFGVRPDTQAFVFATNAIPMLLGGLISGLLLRAANRRRSGHSTALWPTLVPAAAGALWYLYGGLVFEGDAGREYFAGPFYLLAGVVVTGVVAWIACLLTRGAGSVTQA